MPGDESEHRADEAEAETVLGPVRRGERGGGVRRREGDHDRSRGRPKTAWGQDVWVVSIQGVVVCVCGGEVWEEGGGHRALLCRRCRVYEGRDLGHTKGRFIGQIWDTPRVELLGGSGTEFEEADEWRTSRADIW